MTAAPSGTVTFLFTDIEGSTIRWESFPEAMKSALRHHDELLRAAIERNGGHVFKTMGDAFCAAFGSVSQAVEAALEAQRALAAREWSEVDGVRVRMAIHVGATDERDGDYFGPALNRVARLLGIGHGGQVLLSKAATLLVEGRLAPGLALRDLGDHRLKDIAAPERVYQLVAPDLPAEFAALRSLDAAGNALPLEVTSFIGRERELDEIDRALAASRLVTLAGPGGVGKTRLGLRAAARATARFPDGVWFVELANVAEAGSVASEFTVALRAATLPGASLTETIVGTLAHKIALLIVDNCEHVIAETATLLDAILRRAPGVRIVATSRQPLDVAGEFVYRVASLAVPSLASAPCAAQARTYDAVRLFEERARAAAGFELDDANAPAVGEICRQLDGIPLAIELAAPKLAILAPRDLARRLSERFRLLAGGNRTALRRQQTLRALIDWSYDLLDEPERALFRLLAVFSGGWTIDAAEIVCAVAGLDAADVFDVLGSLVKKSLVVADATGAQMRFRFLESIREYALEKLKADANAAHVAERHARYVAAYVREQNALALAMDDRAWQDRVLAEIENVRASLAWSLVERNDPSVGLEILAHLRRPRSIFLPEEAARWFDLGAKAADAAGDATIGAAVLAWHASSNVYSGRPAEERIGVARAAVEAARAARDASLEANALDTLGICLRDAGRVDQAHAVFATAADALARGGSAIDVAELYADWASNDLKRGDVAAARDRLTVSLGASRAGSMVAASALAILAEIDFAAGERERALAGAREAKAAFSALDARLDLGVVSCNLAAYAIAADAFEEAREHVREALDILRGVGSLHVTIALEHWAVLESLAGDPERAARVLGATDTAFAQIGLVREGTERTGFERARARLIERFGAEGFARRAAAGAALSSDAALADVLETERGAGSLFAS